MSEDPPFIDPLVPSFWTYRGDAFEWAAIGSTLALSEEVASAAAFLDPYGCPPIDDLLLYLGAFSDKCPAVITYAGSVFDSGPLEEFIAPDWSDRYDRRCRELKNLANEPPGFPEWKFFLASQALCGSSAPNRLSEALALGTLLPADPPTARRQKPVAFRRFVAAMRKLIAPDFLLDKTEIERLWKTSVGTVPAPPEIDLPEVLEDEPSLFERLRSTSKPAGIAVGVAEALWPAFSIKGRVQRPQDLPLGGFADLSNKGALDRLLPTELAFDDTILAARIVSGEALYVRREAPPIVERHRRLILADCSIRMWGIRRVIATGIALALTRAGTDDVDFEVLRNSADDDAVTSDFGEVSGIMAHLESLSPAADPSRLVAHAIDQLTSEACDIYLLTTAATLDDPGFSAALTVAAAHHSIQLISIAPDGRLGIHHQSAYGRKRLQELTIDLDQIIAARHQVKNRRTDGPLPAIHREHPLPLRIDRKPDLRKAVITDEETIVGVSRTRDLCHWDDPARGALCLSTKAPGGTLLAANTRDSEDSILSVHASKEGTVLFISAPGTSGRTVSLPALPSAPRHAFVLAGSVVIVLCKNILIAFDENGSELHRLIIMTPSLIHRRSLLIGRDLFWLSFSTRITLTPIPDPTDQILFRWRWGSHGCIASLVGGETHVTIDGVDPPSTIATPGLCALEAIAPFGDAVLLRQPDGTRVARILKTKATVAKPNQEWIHCFAPRWNKLDRLPQTIKNFRSLVILPGATLVPGATLGLITRKNALFTISIDPGQDFLILRHDEEFTHASHPEFERHRFSGEDLPKSPKGLQRISFADLADLWLDERGFLHFEPADRNLARLTLTLSVGVMSGWSEHHGCFTPTEGRPARVAAVSSFCALMQELLAVR